MPHIKKLIPASLLSITLLAGLTSTTAQTLIRDTRDNTVKSVPYAENAGLSVSDLPKALPVILELDTSSELKVKYSHPARKDAMVTKFTQCHQNMQVEPGSPMVMARN